MIYYIDKIISYAEYSTIGTYYPIASLLYNAHNARANTSSSTNRPLYGVPQPRWGAESLVMLCNDAGQATIASFADSKANGLRDKLREMPLFRDFEGASRDMGGEELKRVSERYLEKLSELEEVRGREEDKRQREAIGS
jgi:hypothetical protein